MKSFKKHIAEVAQPRSPEEKAFKDQHEYEVIPHPVAEPSQHSGAIGASDLPKVKASRKADVKDDEKAYDKATPQKKADGVKLESTEQDRARYDAADDKDKKKVTLPTAPWDKKKKEEDLSAAQKKIDHNKNGKIDGHDLAMLRSKKKKNEAVNETTSSALTKMVTTTGPDGKTRTVQKKAKADRKDDHQQDIIGEAVRFKKGPIRLKNGKQVMVSDEDAKLLTKMFKDLNPRNQKAMHKVMLMDPAGFEEIRGFAREAL